MEVTTNIPKSTAAGFVTFRILPLVILLARAFILHDYGNLKITDGADLVVCFLLANKMRTRFACCFSGECFQLSECICQLK